MVVTLLAITVTATCAPLDREHRAWSAFLERYSHAGGVDYAGVKAKGLDELEAYLASADCVSAKEYEALPRADQLALLLNVYNAHVIHRIARGYPLRSIRDIPDAFTARVILLPLAGQGAISLDTLEHTLVRARFSEPRVHFALVCGAVSCPQLRSEAYRGDKLEAQLSEQTRQFLGDGSKNRFDAAGKVLYLSAIFDWFRGDFENGSGSLRAFVARHFGEAVLAPEINVRFLEYDWRVNALPRARP